MENGDSHIYIYIYTSHKLQLYAQRAQYHYGAQQNRTRLQAARGN
jgi:hypothetical protein